MAQPRHVMKSSKFIVRGILRVLVFAILTAVGIVAAGVVVVAGFVRLNNTHEGFSDFPVYNKQSSQSCFVEIIHCRYGH